MIFEDIWNNNKLHLRNFIATKVPQDDVPDLLQDVAIKFYENVNRGSEIKNYRNWLFQVTRNTIVDYHKTKIKSSEIPMDTFTHFERNFQPCVCDITEQIINQLLPKKYSHPLVMSDIHKIPQKKIAQLLNLSYENVKSRIQRARKKFKNEIEQSVELKYNKQNQVVGGHLKKSHNLPEDLLYLINKMNLLD